MPVSMPQGGEDGVPVFSPLPAPEDLAEHRLRDASLPDVPASRSGDTFADLSRNERRQICAASRDDDEKERRQRYADLLVDVARRQTLLPSDLIVRNARRQPVKMVIPTTRTALFSSQPLKILTGTKWFTFLSFVLSIFFFYLAISDTGLFLSLNHGGGWWIGVRGNIVKYSLDVGVYYPPEGMTHIARNCSHPVAMPGFGVIERQVSMLSRCKRRKPPKLEWDPAANCSRLILTYGRDDAPGSIFGLFVVQPRGTDAPMPLGFGNGDDCPQPCTSRADDMRKLHDYYRFRYQPADDPTWHQINHHRLSAVSDEGGLGTKLQFNLSRHWTDYVRNWGIWLCYAVCCMAFVVFYFTKNTRFSHPMVCLTMFVISLLFFITHLGLGPPVIGFDDKTSNLASALLYFFFGCIYTMLPKFPDVFFMLHLIGIELIRLVFYDGNSVIETAQTLVPAFIAAIVVANRASVWIRAKISIKKMREKYNGVWNGMIDSSPSARDHLRRLESIVSELENGIPTGTILRQLNLKVSHQPSQRRTKGTSAKTLQNSGVNPGLNPSQSGDLGDSATAESMIPVQGEGGGDFGRVFRSVLVEDGVLPGSGVLSTVQNVHSLVESMPFEMVAATVCEPTCVFERDPLNPVTSLDQLWTQAVLLRGFLLPKVLDLADRFGGVFPVRKQPGTFEKCRDKIWASYKGKLQTGGVKSPKRGAEKVDCIYGGDVSRLLDACRETIVFEGLERLADCLEALKDDPEVMIVRVKSSMTKSGMNPHVRTGFRFISVNLCIKTHQTCKLAVHEHICELLLILKDFAQLVTSESHQEYIGHLDAMSVFDLAILPTVTSAVIAVRRRCAYANFLCLLMMGKCGIVNKSPKFLRGGRRNSVGPEPQRNSVGPEPQRNSVGPEPQRNSVGSEPQGNSVGPEPRRNSVGPEPRRNSVGSEPRRNSVGPEPQRNSVGSEPQASSPSEHKSGSQASNLRMEVEPVFTSWGVHLQESDIHKLECVSRLGSLGLTNLFDSALIKQPEKIIEHNKPSTVKEWIVSSIFNPRSLTATAANRYVLLICLLCGVFLIGSDVYKFRDLESVESYRHFRYMSLADRQGKQPPSTPGIKGFGILSKQQGSCMRLDSAAGVFGDDFAMGGRRMHSDGLDYTTIWDTTSVTLSYSEKVPFTGFFLESPEQGADVSNFVILASNSLADNVSTVPSTDSTWKLVGTPAWGGGFWNSPKIDGFNEGKWTRYTMPTGYEITLFEPTAQVPFGAIRPSVGYGIGCILVAIVGHLNISLVKPLAIFGISCGLVVKLILHATEDRRTAVSDDFEATYGAMNILTSVGQALLLAGVLVEGWSAQWPMLFAFHLCAILTLIAAILASTNDREIGGTQMQMPNPRFPLFSIVIWGLMILVNIVRFIGIRQAQAVVSKDIQAYNEVWERELEQDQGHTALNRLDLVVKSLEQDAVRKDDDVQTSGKLQHIGRKFFYIDGSLAPHAKHTDIASDLTLKKRLGDDVLFEQLNVMSMPYTLDSKNTLRSFHQLYVQAMILHDILRGKVEDWAAQSEGYVAVEPDALPGQSGGVPGGSSGRLEFVKWAEARADPSMVERAKWPPLKRSRRSIEKAERVFEGDMSRLADIVRFAIYFDTFTDLTCALGVIVSDFDIKVDLVKSRLRVDYDSRPTAGYRDVNLKLKICNKETAMLGCDTHICELQLVLKLFGELKSEERHQRYVLFRDLRGE